VGGSIRPIRSVGMPGLERAIWALNHPTDPNDLATPLPAETVPTPYDSSTGIPISVNGVHR
jgi:hypothetical protein